MGEFNKYPKPVLKWAGGKRQLLIEIERHLPDEIANKSITTYVEPMFGGGAVFFFIKQKYGDSINKFYISDYNWDLYVLYRVIKNKLDELIIELQLLSDEYLPLAPTKKGEKEGARIRMFKRIREEYNEDKWHNIRFEDDGKSFRTSIKDTWIRRAALTIFLNRTCFNGLYRVNKLGKFNVPHGRYKKPKIIDNNNLRFVCDFLQGVEISVGSYQDNIGMVDENTFVYFDPPYRPLPNTPSFTDYHKAPFGDDEQKKLANEFKLLHKIGAKVMLSNSDPKNTDINDDFFDKLYDHKDFKINRVLANRNINSDGERRGKISEILVTNYEVK